MPAATPVSALYLHIPFCARRCPYCDFAVSVNRKAEFRAAYIEALLTELETTLAARPCLDTVFFGGGTPTELGASILNQLLDFIRQHAQLAPDAEISLEANPENLNRVFLTELQNGGWNRLSLGVQSLDDAVLAHLGRLHTASMVETVVQAAHEIGWKNVSLDLIYGAPLQSLRSWQQTLEKTLTLPVAHVSCYSLTIESGTAFGRAVDKGQLRAPDDDEQALMMEEAARLLREAGFERYEVSNWAKPGFESRHNQNYWRGGNYFGVGCGAHGHINGLRFWNERDAKTYIAQMQNGNARAGEEVLSPAEQATELIALGLRSCEGFDCEDVFNLLSWQQREELERCLERLTEENLIQRSGALVSARPEALALADGLALRLIPSPAGTQQELNV